ncbi:hypothetical protein P280DRAFT_516840 [Massarina eburnea CBS 473.64]|uniref:Rhodopsin domain-containing protein n=1 Tax=Massarina eburnea CBS 473.64 TaxID=1395130 RepID=A0A6A6S6M2_9PLEO|nr:hypothetical protein P280DRAFT_516840 [Massarina eburnea CBS 473.64]
MPDSSNMDVGQVPSSMAIPADLIVAASICLFFTVAAVCLRVFTKVVDFRKMHIEDYLIIFAGLGFIVFIVLLFAASGAGLGNTHTTLTFENRKHALQYSNDLDILYAPIMFSIKLAILIQLHQLFSGTRKSLIVWGVRALAAINLTCYSAMIFVYIFACNPRAKLYDSRVKGTCIDPRAAVVADSSVNITTNTIMLFFSVLGVSTMQLSVKRKTLVGLVLGLGSFACITSVCRLIYGVGVGVDASLEDYTAIWPVHLWSLAELASIILCACCPTFPRLYQYTQGKRSAHPPSHSKWPLARRSTQLPLVDLERQLHGKEQKSGSLSRNVCTTIPKRSKSQNTNKINPRSQSNLSQASSKATSKASIKSATSPPKNFSRNRTGSPTPIEIRKTLPRAPIRHISNARVHPLQTMSSIPEFERPYSHLSYETFDHDDNISAPPITPSSPTQSHFPLSPTSTHASVSPTQTEFSVAQTEFSVAEVESARPMRILPVYFATIRKTVSVRVSNHTNLGSPISWRKPSFGW